MTPEAALFIQRANTVLDRAAVMLKAGLNEDAARPAYLASRTGKTSKTHQGVRREFFRLTKDASRTDPELRRFLAQSYEFKAVADYFSGPNPVVAPDEAEDAIATARRFVEHFSVLAPAQEGTSGSA